MVLNGVVPIVVVFQNYLDEYSTVIFRRELIRDRFTQLPPLGKLYFAAPLNLLTRKHIF
jgi:hypothetical protein